MIAGTYLGGRAGVGDGVASLGELLDDLGAEGRQVIRLARRDETLVDDDLPVDPAAAGVENVGFQ
jgi:hypothetical protein